MKGTLNFAILITLLVIRYGGDFLALSHPDIKSALATKGVIIFTAFVAIQIAIWLNTKNMQEINIDSVSFFIYMGASVILAWSYLPYQLSIILFLVIARNIYSYINREFVFGSASYSLKATAVAIFVFLPVIPLMVIRGIEIETNLIVDAFINASFFGVVFEEFLFRGLLWKMLKDLGFTERKIIATQAFLFWMAHYHLLLSGSLSFWITIPIISLMLGIVISKSKSLGLSISAHFLYNFFIGFIILK